MNPLERTYSINERECFLKRDELTKSEADRVNEINDMIEAKKKINEEITQFIQSQLKSPHIHFKPTNQLFTYSTLDTKISTEPSLLEGHPDSPYPKKVSRVAKDLPISLGGSRPRTWSNPYKKEEKKILAYFYLQLKERQQYNPQRNEMHGIMAHFIHQLIMRLETLTKVKLNDAEYEGLGEQEYKGLQICLVEDVEYHIQQNGGDAESDQYTGLMNAVSRLFEDNKMRELLRQLQLSIATDIT